MDVAKIYVLLMAKVRTRDWLVVLIDYSPVTGHLKVELLYPSCIAILDSYASNLSLKTYFATEAQ